MTLRHSRSLPAAALIVLTIGVASADVVILKDGFIIQGNVKKEMAAVRDPASGQSFTVPRSNGFDMIDDGPRVTIFSSHHKQLGEVAKNANVQLRPEYRAYINRLENRKGNQKFEGYLSVKELPDFDAKWKRTLEARVPGGFILIAQQVTYLDPYSCFVVSSTHLWSQAFRTSEMDPKKVRQLLATHPDLVEADGKPDPMKRTAIARFMKDAGWLFYAKEEMDRLKKEVPSPSKEAQDEIAKVLKEIDLATGALVATEAELALNAGRYQYAAQVLAAFPADTADPKDVGRFAQVKARLETARDLYANGHRLLRTLIDDVTGAWAAKPHLAVGGGPAIAAWPAKPGGDQELKYLAAAAEVILTDLHPDSAGRIEIFVNLAMQVERERSQGKMATKTPKELLATAASGWARGKSGATTDAGKALKTWGARQAALGYQRSATINERSRVLFDYQKGNPVEIDELTQVIALLPPAQPEDLVFRSGTPIKAGNGVPEGVYRRRTAPFGTHPAGLDYLVKLPPEYHHGRAYPVLMVLTYPGLDAERLLGSVAAEADKQGYILVAPLWCPAFGEKVVWEWKGEDHDFALAALRDAVRHFTVDNDRVFLVGAGEGADMALDVGVSHPDLFAGVIAMGSNPEWRGLFIHYWPNAQKLPVYVVTGELAGGPNFQLRYLFQEWMPKGFPALQVVYRGRGVEWFPAEVPVIFDWMSKKKRVNGVATLNLVGDRRFSWQTRRPTDNRFYWLGAEKIDSGHVSEVVVGKQGNPAELSGDIKANNIIDLKSRGVRVISVWLSLGMIDWTKKVDVRVNGGRPNGWTPKVLEQDVEVLLEDFWQRGDRRMLFLAKVEVANPF